MIKCLMVFIMLTAGLSAHQYTELNGEWRDIKEPRIIKIRMTDEGLGELGIYGGKFCFQQNSIKLCGSAEFHEKKNELYIKYINQIVNGKQTNISESAKYIVFISSRPDGLRYIMLITNNPKEHELGVFYFYRKI